VLTPSLHPMPNGKAFRSMPLALTLTLTSFFLCPPCPVPQARVRADGAALVHCNEGRSRSVALVAAYLIRTHGLRADQVQRFLLPARSFDRLTHESRRHEMAPRPCAMLECNHTPVPVGLRCGRDQPLPTRAVDHLPTARPVANYKRAFRAHTMLQRARTPVLASLASADIPLPLPSASLQTPEGSGASGTRMDWFSPATTSPSADPSSSPLPLGPQALALIRHTRAEASPRDNFIVQLRRMTPAVSVPAAEAEAARRAAEGAGEGGDEGPGGCGEAGGGAGEGREQGSERGAGVGAGEGLSAGTGVASGAALKRGLSGPASAPPKRMAIGPSRMPGSEGDGGHNMGSAGGNGQPLGPEVESRSTGQDAQQPMSPRIGPAMGPLARVEDAEMGAGIGACAQVEMGVGAMGWPAEAAHAPTVAERPG
jgi:hypothetical protein